jgi:hypothetical protein
MSKKPFWYIGKTSFILLILFASLLLVFVFSKFYSNLMPVPSRHGNISQNFKQLHDGTYILAKIELDEQNLQKKDYIFPRNIEEQPLNYDYVFPRDQVAAPIDRPPWTPKIDKEGDNEN